MEQSEGAPSETHWPRSVVLAVRLLLAVAVLTIPTVMLIVALQWWLDDVELTLAYLKVLVWPAVVAIVIWWLRAPILDKFKDLEEARGPYGLHATFANRTRAKEETLLESAEGLATDDDPPEPPPEALESPDETGAPASADATPAPPTGHAKASIPEPTFTVADRRRRTEDLMRESAQWGWNAAKAGIFKSEPNPEIEWDANGKPRIAYGSSRGVDFDPKTYARRLQEEIKRLQDARHGPMWQVTSMSRQITGDPDAARLAKYKRQLREIDPNNPYGQEVD